MSWMKSRMPSMMTRPKSGIMPIASSVIASRISGEYFRSASIVRLSASQSFGRTCQSQDSIQNNLAMVLALFRINVENLPFSLREACTVMQHCAILQGGRSDGGDIEGLLAFGLSNGCTEVSQSPDCGIIHHKHGSGLFVCPGHTYDRFFYVVSQFLRSRNIAARLFHIPTVLLVWPYVLSLQASARVPPRSSEAPGFFFRSPAICPVRRCIRTDASPA